MIIGSTVKCKIRVVKQVVRAGTFNSARAKCGVSRLFILLKSNPTVACELDPRNRLLQFFDLEHLASRISHPLPPLSS